MIYNSENEFLKLDNEVMAKLYEAFKDNDGFMLKEDEKYSDATNEILELYKYYKPEHVTALRNIRNGFVMTVSDIMSASRMLADIDKSLGKVYNVWLNMMQYVTTEIDIAIANAGGEV